MLNKDKFKKLGDEELQKSSGGAYVYDGSIPSDYHCAFNSNCSDCEHYFD